MASTLRKQIGLQQIAPDTYTASWHVDWTLGSTLFGGSVAAMIHHAAITHFTTDPTLVKQNQPDILSVHIEFLRPCNRCESTITITPLKIGATLCTIQLKLLQKNQIKVIALANSTNFDKQLGPTAPTAWNLLPPPKPIPDFQKVLTKQPEKHWLPAHLSGEIIPITKQLIILNPRGGFPVDGTCDGWYGLRKDEGHADDKMDATYLAMMTDVIPSMSDTLLHNEGLYDAHAFYQKMEAWAKDHPGSPVEVVNSVDQALEALVYNNTVTLDLEFKRRLPDGLRWIFTRVATKMLREGRMDLDITICDDKMELICAARQLIVVLEAQRKFRPETPKAAL
ncbi:thioesterase family protein [Xylaria telfairii]|nr:thioesterase family protein [Xylaria telfairii]